MFKSLIVCDGPNCTFDSLVQLTQNFITDAIVLSTFLAIIIFIIIGFKFLTSQGSSSALADAKKKLRSLVLGYFFILCAWLIVYTISNVLLSNPGAYSLLK